MMVRRRMTDKGNYRKEICTHTVTYLHPHSPICMLPVIRGVCSLVVNSIGEWYVLHFLPTNQPLLCIVKRMNDVGNGYLLKMLLKKLQRITH